MSFLTCQIGFAVSASSFRVAKEGNFRCHLEVFQGNSTVETTFSSFVLKCEEIIPII